MPGRQRCQIKIDRMQGNRENLNDNKEQSALSQKMSSLLSLDYVVTDVFTDVPLRGNPVAVVLDGSKLSTEQMHQIAHWTNLSETTFVVPTRSCVADYGVRIFTPSSELPFAGHPSLGTAHTLLEKGLINGSKNFVIQECPRGLVTIEISREGGSNKLYFGIDGLQSERINSEQLYGCLPGLSLRGNPYIVNIGPKWIVVEASNTAEQLLDLQPDFAKIKELSLNSSATGICVFASVGGKGDIELRTFAPLIGVNEDPVCGSGNAAVAHYRNVGSAYTCFQGSAVSRNGVVSVHYKDSKIWVGGCCCLVVDGRLTCRI